MNVKDVVVMKEVADDLNDGKAFYIREHGLYRMLSRRFPYAIYYEIVEGIAYVIAVLPMRRNPAWLKSKLQERS